MKFELSNFPYFGRLVRSGAPPRPRLPAVEFCILGKCCVAGGRFEPMVLALVRLTVCTDQRQPHRDRMAAVEVTAAGYFCPPSPMECDASARVICPIIGVLRLKPLPNAAQTASPEAELDEV